MSNNVIIQGSLQLSGNDLPTRVGERVESEDQIANIVAPFVGLIIYIKDQDSFVYVKSLKSKKIGNIEIKNALVDEYKPLLKENFFLNWNDVS